MSSDVPHVVSMNALFDGELTGDELMDIYNYNSNDVGIHDMIFPELETSAIDGLNFPGIESSAVDECHPGMAVALAAAAMDDGLASQPPLLLPSVNEELTFVSSPFLSESVQEASLKTSSKKRGIRHTVEVPEAKRMAIASSPMAARPSLKIKPSPVAANVSVETPPQPVASTTAIQASPVPSSPEQQVVIEGCPAPTNIEAKPIVDETAEDNSDDVNGILNTPVDTSTEHIKALTSESWIAACPKVSGAPTSTSTQTKAARQNMSPEERKRQNRDRNREHARNTRLRKKAYMEELKRTLNSLVEQRDASEAEKRKEAQHGLEQREVRFRVAEEFLKMKGRNEADSAIWSAILEDGFELTQPLMNFYKLTKGEKTDSSEFVLKGAASVKEDNKNFYAFLQTLRSTATEQVSLQFACDRQSFFMDGCNAFIQWSANYSGSDKVFMRGVMRCVFNPASNKLISASLSFDTGVLAAQASTAANKMSGMYILVPASQVPACERSVVSCDDHSHPARGAVSP